MQQVLHELLQGGSLTRDEAQRAFELIFAGQANESQVAAMLALLAVKGVTLDELIGGAIAMRRHVTPVPVKDDPSRPILDTCGTGGAAKTFNISTAAAIVAAAARNPGKPVERLRVAKHGGRSRTGRGSAEVLKLLGVNIDASPEVQAKCLDDVGVCFSFAVNHHPAMKFAAGPRKSLGFPTIFNLLGPLTNPAGAKRQLLGVWDGRYAEPVAAALLALGAEQAMVVHGLDGMDEISTCDQTFFARVDGSAGVVRTQVFDPLSIGIGRSRHVQLLVNTPDEGAVLIRKVLAGGKDESVCPAREIVLLNAAAALLVGGLAEHWAEAMAASAEAIDSGRAKETLENLSKRSHGAA